jgi:succinate dehydrogenase/fumarate reductase cytochrome b subunit
MILRKLHRTSAIVVGVFAVVHIANHLAALAGVSAHISFMEIARAVYRQRIIEATLLLCVLFQILSGLWLVMRGWRQRRGIVARIQAIAGAYMAYFLFAHVSAMLYGRAILNLDTNFYFGAAGLHVPPYQFIFAPYYFLAVVAFFIHLGCAVYWHIRTQSREVSTLAIALPAGIGGVVSLLIVLSLAGVLQPVEIPAIYKATFEPQDR